MPVNKIYPPISEEQIKRDIIQTVKGEIESLEQQCIRPLLEIHYLQEQGKDIAQEKAFLNQRYAQILEKRAELQNLDA